MHVPVKGVIGARAQTTDNLICLWRRRTLSYDTPIEMTQGKMLAKCTAQKLNQMYKLLASKQPQTWQCTLSAPVQHTGQARKRSCERFARYARYRFTDRQNYMYRQRQSFAELLDIDISIILCCFYKTYCSLQTLSLALPWTWSTLIGSIQFNSILYFRHSHRRSIAYY